MKALMFLLSMLFAFLALTLVQIEPTADVDKNYTASDLPDVGVYASCYTAFDADAPEKERPKKAVSTIKLKTFASEITSQAQAQKTAKRPRDWLSCVKQC